MPCARRVVEHARGVYACKRACCLRAAVRVERRDAPAAQLVLDVITSGLMMQIDVVDLVTKNELEEFDALRVGRGRRARLGQESGRRCCERRRPCRYLVSLSWVVIVLESLFCMEQHMLT